MKALVRLAVAVSLVAAAVMGCGQPPSGQTCGGIANLKCPTGMVCVDNPNDSCDPANGGADCSGICR